MMISRSEVLVQNLVVPRMSQDAIIQSPSSQHHFPDINVEYPTVAGRSFEGTLRLYQSQVRKCGRSFLARFLDMRYQFRTEPEDFLRGKF